MIDTAFEWLANHEYILTILVAAAGAIWLGRATAIAEEDEHAERYTDRNG